MVGETVGVGGTESESVCVSVLEMDGVSGRDRVCEKLSVGVEVGGGVIVWVNVNE